jgi:hypothetical protein
VPVRVLLVCRVVTQVNADRQEDLVHRVGGRVSRLGEHRGAAGEQADREFAGRDRGVGPKGCQHGLLATFCHGAPLSLSRNPSRISPA